MVRAFVHQPTVPTMPSLPHQRVIACVIRDGDRYLVCQRPTHKRHGGLWEFPGGKSEPNESDEHAAARELDEELGVELVRASSAIFEIADPGSEYLIVFVPVEIRGEPQCLEHSRMTYGTPAELLELPLAPSDRAFLEFVVRGDVMKSDVSIG